MNLKAYNSFCRSLPATAHVVQWGGSHVWKVGGATGKVFAIAAVDEGSDLRITFKCSPASYAILKEQPGLQPAPYLASRGMPWIQRCTPASMDDAALKDYLRASHGLAAANLTRKQRLACGLD
mgnify:FL=1